MGQDLAALAAGQVSALTLHRDGGAWSVVPMSSHYEQDAVWGSGPADVWAGGGYSNGVLVGQLSRVARWDGAAWRESGYPFGARVLALGGSGSRDVWGVSLTAIWHFDGAWSAVPLPDSPASLLLDAVWSSGPDDVWLGGQDGVLYHEAGGRLSLVSDPGGRVFRFTGLWGSGPGDLWGVTSDGLVVRRSGAQP